jgi:hypothetical protein
MASDRNEMWIVVEKEKFKKYFVTTHTHET